MNKKYFKIPLDKVITLFYTLNMDKEIKDKLLQIRISRGEKEEMERIAKEKGFDSVSAYILFVFRKHGR